MSKSVINNKLSSSGAENVLPVSKGGTGGSTPLTALGSLNLVPESQIDQPNGVAGLDSNGKLHSDQLPDGLGVLINGPAEVNINSVHNYTIVGYSNFNTYDVIVSAGSVVVTNETIAFTAPAVNQVVNMSVNGSVFAINIVPITTHVATPSIITPVSGASNIGASVSIAATTFTVIDGSDTHEGTDWQIATDVNFTNIVASVINSGTNKTSWNGSGLSVSTTYYARVRYKGVAVGYSNWSPVINFTTKATFYLTTEGNIITGTSIVAGDFFGSVVDLSDDGSYAIIGAYGKDISPTTDMGIVDILYKNGANWVRQARLLPMGVASSMSMIIPTSTPGSDVRVVITGSTPSDTTYVSTTNITIPVGTTAISVTGKGSRAETRYNPGQGNSSYPSGLPPYQAGYSDYEWVFFGKGETTPTAEPMYTLVQPSPTIDADLHPGIDTHAGPFSEYSYNVNGLNYKNYVTNIWRSTLVQVVPTQGNPAYPSGLPVYIAPNYDYVNGNNATVTFGGNTYTFAGASATEINATNQAYASPGTWIYTNATTSMQSVILITANDFFGTSVSINADGTTAVVGAHSGENASGVKTGTAYVFTRTGVAWTLQQKLDPSDGVANDSFGFSSCISDNGNMIIIGAVSKNSAAGKAYVFTRSGITWTQETTITPADTTAGMMFGSSIALNSTADIAVIGAYGDTSFTGSAYIFTRSGTTWTQQAKLVASDPSNNNYFGQFIDINAIGNTIAIGAYGNNTFKGAVYIFTGSGAVWTQQSKLTVSGYADSQGTGASISLTNDGDTLLVGSYRDSPGGLTNAGAAYLFTRSGTTWTQEAIRYTASDKATGDMFGNSVSISGNGGIALIGAMYKTVSGTIQAGAVYAFY